MAPAVVEGEVHVPGEQQLHPMAVQQLEQPGARGLAQVVVVAQVGLVGGPQVGGHVQEEEGAAGRMGGQVVFEPLSLLCFLGQARIHQLRVEHGEVQVAPVEAVPGRAVTAVVQVEGAGGDRMGGHGGVGFVAHIVVAGHVAHGQGAGAQLLQGLVQGAVEDRGVGVFLDQVAQVDGEVGLEGGGQMQGRVSAGGLQAAGGEFDGPVTGVEHVVGVGDDDEFTAGRGQQGAVEERLFHGHGRDGLLRGASGVIMSGYRRLGWGAKSAGSAGGRHYDGQTISTRETVVID